MISADSYPTGLGRVTGRSARLVARAGFHAAYVTGSGVSMSVIGAPDMGALSSAELIERAQRIADSVEIPVICDIDTGFGGPINVIRTIRDLESAGVSAVQIEDQVWPKICGHEPGCKLVSAQEMTSRIKAAADARHDSDFLIIARTDARTDQGLDAALDRAATYADAGADILFVESPESCDEMQTINTRLTTPTMANIVDGGRTPLLPAADLETLGYRLAIYPNSLTRLIGHMGELLSTLQSTGTTDGMRNRMLDHRALWDRFDYPEWTALEDRFNSTD